MNDHTIKSVFTRGLALILLLSSALSPLGLSCSSGGDAGEEDASLSKKSKPSKKKKPRKGVEEPAVNIDEPSKEDEPPSPEAEGNGEEPGGAGSEETTAQVETKRLLWNFPEGTRFSYQVRFELEAKSGEKVKESFRIDGTRFLRCTKGEEGVFPIVRLEPNPVEEVIAGEPVRARRAAATAELLKVAPSGELLARESDNRNRLLFGMGEPVFGESPVPMGSSWTLERDFEEGRFAFTYLLERETEFEGKPCLAIRLAVTIPGGAPCDDFTLSKGEGVIWFDPDEGRLLKAMGELAFTRGSGENAVVSKGSFEITFYDHSAMEPREAVEAKGVLDAYFKAREMIAKKRYSGAEKKIEEFVEETGVIAYAEIVNDLLNGIPDPRSIQPKGLLDRKRFDFLKLPWSRKRGPPLHAMGLGKMEDGKPRKLEAVGQKAPQFWWKRLHVGGNWKDVEKDFKGKVILIHVWISWVPPCSETLVTTKALADKFHDKGLRLLGITLDTEGKDLASYLKKKPIEHPTVWDADNEAVRKFGLPGAPAFIVLNKSGDIVFGEVGYFGEKTMDRIEEAVKDALK